MKLQILHFLLRLVLLQRGLDLSSIPYSLLPRSPCPVTAKPTLENMPITALPETTVRLLGSAAALSAPVDVVKELLDNALDAAATSVEILVTANLVDSIQVRDNGHGIQAGDYNSLGRMGHTSKLTSFEELRTFVGDTLGFRGQALASANSLGCVTVVTRCIGDPTAVKLTLCAGVGGVESQQRVAAPVGTTVTVTGLFKSVPVRRQVAEKDAHKNLAKTKHLLHAYAVARPMIRVSLKVLGGDTKQTWSYSPCPDACVRDAVIQVFGAAVMSECLLKTLATETSARKEENTRGGPRITVEAVLPRPDADLSTLSKGAFFSVDSRPVSTSRGIMKKLLSNLKSHFRKSLEVDAEDRRLSDLFTCVNIRCSPGSYDPNVEPSKSQVLFADESQLLHLFEELCSKTYQSRQTVNAFVTIEKRPLTRRTQTRTPPPSSDGPQAVTELPEHYLDEPSQNTYIRKTRTRDVCSPNAVLRGSSGPNAVPSHRVDSRHRAPETQPAEELGPAQSLADRSGGEAGGEIFSKGSVRLVEPLVVPIHGPEASTELLSTPGQKGTAEQPSTLLRTHDAHAAKRVLPDQENPYYRQGQKRGFVVNMSTDPDLSSDEEGETGTSGSGELQEAISPPEERSDNSKEALDPWTIARMTAPARQTATDDTFADSAGRHPGHAGEPQALPVPSEPCEDELPILRPPRGAPRDLDTPRVMRFTNTHIGHLRAADDPCPDSSTSGGPQTAARVAAHDLPLSPLRTERSSERRKLPNSRPQRHILEDDVDPDGLVQTTISFDQSRQPRQNQMGHAQLHIDDVPTRRNPPFRKPKRVPKKDQGDARRNAWSSSERGDYAIRSRNGNRTENVPSSDFDGDPRKYLIRRQRSEAAHRRKGRQSIKRTKTDKLPLEIVPSGDGTKHLVLSLDHGIVATCDVAKRTPSLAEYSEGGHFGATMNLEDVDDIQSRLQTVLSCWTEKTFGEKAGIEIDLWEAVKSTQVAA